MGFVVFQPEQRFEKIVVAVDDRYVDLRFAGFRTDAVVDQESVLLPCGNQVAVRCERVQDLFCRFIIEFFLLGNVFGQLAEAVTAAAEASRGSSGIPGA